MKTVYILRYKRRIRSGRGDEDNNQFLYYLEVFGITCYINPHENFERRSWNSPDLADISLGALETWAQFTIFCKNY